MSVLRLLVLAAGVVTLVVVYNAMRPQPVQHAPTIAAPELAPGSSLLSAPLPPLVVPIEPRVLPSPTLAEVYHSEADLVAHLEYLNPQQAIMVDGKVVRSGFGPAIRFQRNADGSLMR